MICTYKISSSVEPKDRIYVIVYELLSLAKNSGKNLSCKYGKNVFDHPEKMTGDALKPTSKRTA